MLASLCFPVLIFTRIRFQQMGDSQITLGPWQKVLTFFTAPATKFMGHVVCYQYLISHVVIIINTKFMGHMVVVLELFIYTVSHMFQTKYPATEIDGQFVFGAQKEFRRRLFSIKGIFSSF